MPNLAPAPIPVPDTKRQTTKPALARFKNTAIPVATRLREIDALGKSNTPTAARVLMALGDDNTYLNYAAVAALGRVKQPGVNEYLEGKMTHADPKVVAAAVKSLADALGTDAIAAIAGVLEKNHKRDDGYQDLVCTACVEALASIKSPDAVPALARELEETVGKDLLYDYGSVVVVALKDIGDASGKAALVAYAERLATAKAHMKDNPMGRRYLDGKIDEAKNAADELAERVIQ